MPVPSNPVISAAQSGLLTLFKPSLVQLQQLGNYLWTNITDFIDNLNKLFVNPMDYIVALNIFPVVPETGQERAINIGSVTSTVFMPPVLDQWQDFDCGTVRVTEYWGNYLDYAPYTKMSLFLPFIGSVQLNTDEIMENEIGVKYKIDLLSGQCVAMVTVNGDVYYQYTGECSVSVPLTGSDWSRIYSAAIGAVGTAITGGIGAATAGRGSPTAGLNASANSINAAANAGNALANINATSKGVKGVTAMRQQMMDAVDLAMQNAMNAANSSGKQSRGILVTRIANTVDNTVSQVMSGKLQISHSGSISGSAGMLGVKTPFILVEYPEQSLADNYAHFVGYPSNMKETLGSLSGYTEVEQVLLNIPGTDDELAELIEALKGGVYL